MEDKNQLKKEKEERYKPKFLRVLKDIIKQKEEEKDAK